MPELTYQHNAVFPPNTLLIVLPGCSGCDSPPEYLYRVYRNRGDVHVEEIYTAPEEFTGRTEPRQQYILNFTAAPGLTAVTAAICTQGYCGYVADADAEHQITLYTSRDAGASWQEEATITSDTGLYPLTQTSEGVVLYPIETGGLQNMRYPNGASYPVNSVAETIFDYGQKGEVLFTSGTAVIRADGTELADLPDAERVLSVLAESGSPVISFWQIEGAGRLPNALTVDRPDGLYGFRTDQWITPVKWLTENSILAFGSTPDFAFGDTVLLLDLANGVAHAVGGVFDEEPFAIPQAPGALAIKRSNVIIGQAFGTFQRVESGDCLNVREAASTTAGVINCLVDDALVFNLDEAVTADHIDWTHVRLMDGREGWAASEFLIED